MLDIPASVQSPETAHNVDRLSHPVDVLPFQTQVLTRPHSCRVRDRERWAMRSGQCGLEKHPHLLHRQRLHFVSGLLR